MESGIRQGCPLSPMVFVLVNGLLLIRLRSELGAKVEAKAFADDVGLVVRDFDTTLSKLIDLL